MGFLDKLRAGFQAERTAHAERLDTLNGDDATAKLLFLAERSFAKGKKWSDRAFEDAKGNRCLLGALHAMRVTHGVGGDQANKLLEQAIAERLGHPASIPAFNDSRSSYREVAGVLARARQIASQAAPARQAQLMLEHASSLGVTVTVPPARAKITVRK